MNKKVFLAFFVLCLCFILLIFSYSEWKDKISSYENDVSAEKLKITKPVSPKKVNSGGNVIDNLSDLDSLMLLTKNQDESVQKVLKADLIKGI